MAKRYCGNVVIDVVWVAEKDRYRALVRGTKSTQVTWVGQPAVNADAVDYPKAYDAAAQAALTLAVEEDTDIADDAASGIRGDYVITRKPLG